MVCLRFSIFFFRKLIQFFLRLEVFCLKFFTKCPKRPVHKLLQKHTLAYTRLFFHRFCGNKHNRFSETLSLGDKSLSLGKILEFRRNFLRFYSEKLHFSPKISKKFPDFPDFCVKMWRLLEFIEKILSLDCLEFRENRWKKSLCY